MNLFLSYRISLKLWLAPSNIHGDAPYGWPPERCRAIFPSPEVPDASLLRALPSQLVSSDGKVDLVVPSVNLRSQASASRCLVWKGPDTGAGSFARILPEVLISTPEACFAQYAQEIRLGKEGKIEAIVKLAKLAYMLCGTYRVFPGFGIQFGVEPLTSVKSLRRFVSRLSRQRGKELASEALKYVLDGSGSPAETRLAIAFSFPFHLGGFNMPPTELNKVGEARNKVDGSVVRFRNDLYWDIRSGIALEYNGIEYHSGERVTISDTDRQLRILSNGVRIIYVTRMQTRSPRALNELACVVQRELGLRSRCRQQGIERLRFALWRSLYGA